MIGNYLRIALFCSFTFLCCSSSQTKTKVNLIDVEETKEGVKKSAEYQKSYDYETPSATFILDRKLAEISGLEYDEINNQFLSINDEEGIIYFLDPNSFETVTEQKFGKKGDYEAISLTDDNIVVSKNTGTLYFKEQSSNETYTFNTELNARNDVEGLCFDKKNNSLLLACKGQAIDNKGSKKDQKCVYRFDIENKKLDKEPFFTIIDNELLSFVESMNLDGSKTKLKKLKRRVKNFSPSGIAIHPVSGDYYLTSGRSSLLLIIGINKQIKDVIFLNSKSNPQPEGITFDKENNLYISTEGKGYSGKVFKFAYTG